MERKHTHTVEEILEAMRRDKTVRRAIARRSFRFFFLFYFAHYVDTAPAPFHYELFELLQENAWSMLVVSAFRNSGKSTILSLAYVTWCVVNGRSKFTLIASENQQKARALLLHIRSELEKDGLLKKDLGPFQEEHASWNVCSLTIKNYGANISAISTEQSVRGLRHGTHRPDLFVLDDCESNDSVKTTESRDKLSRWLGSDVIPAGHRETRTIVIGSILHPDSLIPRLQREIDAGHISGTYRRYPIVNDEGAPTWPARYPNPEAIETEKQRGMSERDWIVEYLLKPFVEKDQIIRHDDIRYYDRPPACASDTTFIGVDLAFTEGSGDYTAMVAGVVVYTKDSWELHVLPYPVNMQLNGSAVLDRIETESLKYGNGQYVPVFIENVAAQQVFIEFAQERGIPAEGVSPRGQDKRARLNSASAFIKRHVRFPRRGAELLVNQILFFGTERHDDLVDALVYLVLKVAERERARVRTFSLTPAQSDSPTRSESEAWADQGARLCDEAKRSQDPTKREAYRTWQSMDRQKRLEYAQERRRFNAEMRKRRGWS